MDLYRIFKPVIYICRLFCLAPFAAVEDSDSTRYKFSIFWLLYSILGVCASFTSQISVFWIPLTLSDAGLFNSFSHVTLTATSLASVVTQIFCLKNGKDILRILDHVSVLDSEHSGGPISYYRLYKVFSVHLIYCMISVVAPNILWLAALNTNSAYVFKFVYHTTVYFMCHIVLLLSDTQFIHFVLLLRYRFSVLNDTVMNFTVQSLHKKYLNHVIRAPAMDRSVNASISAVSSSITVLKSTLRKVCRHHDSLCDISELVNRTYSLQILLSVTVTCIQVLHTTFSFGTEMSTPNALTWFTSKQFLSMSALFRFFADSSKVVLLVAVCNRTSHEVSVLHLWCPHVCFLNTWPTE